MTDDEVRKEVEAVYGPDLEAEFGQIDETLIDDITSIYTHPEEWKEEQ